jgi:hypothetical protein
MTRRAAMYPDKRCAAKTKRFVPGFCRSRIHSKKIISPAEEVHAQNDAFGRGEARCDISVTMLSPIVLELVSGLGIVVVM